MNLLAAERKFKIMIVDDSPTGLILLEEILKRTDYQVVACNNAHEALIKVADEDFDLFLLDVMMPEMDGYELCTRLKQMDKCKEVPVIFLTAKIDNDSLVEGFNVGAVDYLKKPYIKNELLVRVKTHLELKYAKDKLKLQLEEIRITQEQLRMSEEKFRTIIEKAPVGVLLTDVTGTIIEWNKGMSEVVEVPKELVIGKKIWDVHTTLFMANVPNTIPPEVFRGFVENVFKTGNSQHLKLNTTLDISINFESNRFKNLSLIYFVIQTNEGYRLCVVVQDTSERKRLELSLKQNEEKFRNIFNNTNDAIIIISENGIIIEANSRATEKLGCMPEELINNPVEKFISKKYFRLISDFSFDNPQPMMELELITKNGENLPVEISSTKMLYNNQNTVLSVIRDISERKMLERKIISTIIETEEKERIRIAQDLHDGIGATLSSINIYINLMRSAQLTQAENESMLIVMRGLTDEAIASAKEIANNLRPTILSRFGFIAALQSYCENINKSGAIEIKIDGDLTENLQLALNADIVLYRTCQELINNTLKYAKARNIYIHIHVQSKILSVIYEDNGVGFNLDEIQKSSKGMGIYNIKNRIGSLRGSCIFKTSPGKGLKVSFEIPLENGELF